MQVWLYQSRSCRVGLSVWLKMSLHWIREGCLSIECGDAWGRSHARGAAAGVNKTTNSGASVIYALQIKELFSTIQRLHTTTATGEDWVMVIVRHRRSCNRDVSHRRMVRLCVGHANHFASKARRTFQTPSSTLLLWGRCLLCQEP